MGSVRLVGVLLVTLVACGDGAPDGRARTPRPAAEVECVVGPLRAGPRVWRVRSGETLHDVARKVYGDERMWEEIAAANADRIDGDGAIPEGTELLIPHAGR